MSSTRHWANAACDRSDQEVISWWSEASTSIFRDKRHKGPDATDVSYVPMCGVPFAPRCGRFQCKHDWRMHYNPRFDGPHRSYYQVHVVCVHGQTTVDAVRGDWRWPWRTCKPAPICWIRVSQPSTTPCWCACTKVRMPCIPCETRENLAGHTTMQVVLALRVRLGLISVGISRSYNQRKIRQLITEVGEDLKKGWSQDTDDENRLTSSTSSFSKNAVILFLWLCFQNLFHEEIWGNLAQFSCEGDCL